MRLHVTNVAKFEAGADVRKNTVSRILAGARPRDATLEKLAAFLGDDVAATLTEFE